MFDRLQIVQRAASLGGVESLVSLPVLTSQYGFTDEQLAAAGVTRGMLRLSVGLEHADDLIADLDQALGRKPMSVVLRSTFVSCQRRRRLRVVLQELLRQLADAGGDADAGQIAELARGTCSIGTTALAIDAMAAGAADVAERGLHELAGVARVARGCARSR